ncbi:hypothetical protein BDR22DRAFT_929253 [Usnea florida]
MVRRLKHHESKLLKKVDFTTYKSDSNHHAAAICRRYTIQDPNDYTKYNRICGRLRQLAHALAALPPTSRTRLNLESQMLDKLHAIGILSTTTKPSDLERKISVSRFARRRLAVVMTRLRMADNVTAAVKFVEQGHVRVGTEVVTEPGFLVTRGLEDFVTWVDGSKVRRNVLRYRDRLDDFDLL